MTRQDFEGRCMKCKTAVIVRNGELTITEKGKMILKGRCPNCGTIVCRFISKEQANQNIQPSLNNQEQVSGVRAEVPEKVPDSISQNTSQNFIPNSLEEEKQRQWEAHLNRKLIKKEEYEDLKKKEKQLPFFKIVSIIAIILLAGFLILVYQGKFQSSITNEIQSIPNVTIDAKSTNNYDFKPNTAVANYYNITNVVNLPQDILDLMRKLENLTLILNYSNST